MAPFQIAGKRGGRFDMLPDFHSYTPKLNGRILSGSERAIFFDRLNELVNSDVLIIYRGDNKAKILERYNNSTIPQLFNAYLFMLGTKGRYFFQEVQGRIQRTGNIFPISDISTEFFSSIFDMLNALISTNSDLFSNSLKRRFINFIEREIDLVSFFQEQTHKDSFLTTVARAKEKDKLLIRDYYLNLLHHFGKSEFYPISFLLSATTSFSVAIDFVKNEISKENEIIFFGWVPRGNRDMMLHTSHYNFFRRKVMEQHNLPMYKMSFFPKQKEITLKGGFLPHYMIGYFYTESGNKYFEVNPVLFEEKKANWLKEGFPIDQSAFLSIAANTTLERGVYVDRDGNFGDIELQ